MLKKRLNSSLIVYRISGDGISTEVSVDSFTDYVIRAEPWFEWVKGKRMAELVEYCVGRGWSCVLQACFVEPSQPDSSDE